MNGHCRTNHRPQLVAAVKCDRRMTFVMVRVICSMMSLTSIASSFHIPSYHSSRYEIRQMPPILFHNFILQHPAIYRSQPLFVTHRSKFDFSIPPININEEAKKKKEKNDQSSTKIDIKTIIPSKAAAVHFNSDIRTSTESITSSSSILENLDGNQYLVPFGLVTLIGIVSWILSHVDFTIDEVIHTVQQFLQDPQTVLNQCIETVQGMGPLGIVYFGIVYVLAEVLAIPAVPLSVSAGYLFGLPMGVSIVLLSATIAASISFVIGKTILRSFVVTNILQQNPKLAKIDRIIGERGFNLLIVLRLSPLFPFALSNYVYGASSIDFVSYFWATLLGFAPGTIAYVYTGMVGKEIMFNTDGVNDQPWYVYGIGFTLILGIMKVISDTASGILKSLDDDDDGDGAAKN